MQVAIARRGYRRGGVPVAPGLARGVEPAGIRRDRARAAAELLEVAGPQLRRVARRVSICADDADDALGRALLVLLTKAPPIEGGRLAAWMTVVTRREALAVRRARDPGIDTAALDAIPSDFPGPAERAERAERVAKAKLALAGLKPAERVAIVLQAEGYSYAEICGLCGWSYTKVNRLLAEGRTALRAESRSG
jgi:RNA polymerase sigma factor (sigma-70 family)